MICDMDSTAHEWMIEYPQTEQVFHQLGIDTSCGGKSVFYLCTQQGIDPDALLAQLQRVVEHSQHPRDDKPDSA